MERLTYREGDKAYTDSQISSTLVYAKTNDKMFPYKPDHDIFSGDPIGRLAAYEDTGLTPSEIMDGKLLTGWIPVSEKLPEPGERVIFMLDNFVGEGYLLANGNWERHHGIYPFSDNPTHWMPMPEPPKEVHPDVRP